MGEIKKFPLSTELAQSHIAEALRLDNLILPKIDGGQWQKTVTSLQVLKCLEAGEIRDQPEDVGNAQYIINMYRCCAGVAIKLKVLLHKNDEGWGIRVIEVKHE